MEIATSRYHNGAGIHESGLLPLGITVGSAKWLPYELGGNVGALAPFGLRKIEDDRLFRKAYRERLEAFGFAAIADLLQAFLDTENRRRPAESQLRGVVLLCFEKIPGPEMCHRRVFADWWQDGTGEAVPELPDAAAQP